MPGKRKHQSTGLDASFTTESPCPKRSRRSFTNQSDLALLIYETVKDYEDEDNHVISETFMKLPSKKNYPDYYEKIVDPVDLTKIGQRIRMDEYRDIEILTTDFQLMVSNAKKYYEETSQEYIDACNLWEIYLNTKHRILEEAKLAEQAKAKQGRKEADVTLDDLKELYENLVTETDESGRVIADMFMQLPDRSIVEYYEKIKDPVDFLMIGEKLDDGGYSSISEMERDVMQLVKNARTYNERHSQIYDDATTLKCIFREKASELEKSKKPEIPSAKTSARIKQRKSWGRASERLQDRATKPEPGVKSEIHEASIPNPRDSEVQALFYNEVVNYRNNLGHTISDPFVRLPNKRFYPMYYDEIENPISLKLIRKKIQTRKYENCEELRDDFILLFSNAMQFNVGTSQIYKDAIALQQFMESKLLEYAAREEETVEDESTSEEEQENKLIEEKSGTGSENIDEAMEESVIKDEGVKKKRRRQKRKGNKSREYLHDRLRLLYETVLEAEDEDGREMITLFLEKPSRKDYPDYYKLVLEPIDMRMIDRKIRHEKYMNVEDLLDDFNLMFNNARHYNEPGSEVYSDADALEKILLDKNKELGPLEISLPSPRSTSKKSSASALEEKLEKLFTGVHEYTDCTQRKICDIFAHLPTKHELPDYYKVIKKPMEMDRIQQRMQTGQYTKLDEMLLDMLLMFENACVYNEPGSIIYKDALILQKVAVEKYYELEVIENVPPTAQLVQEMLTSLFMSVMNHQDESGRCYSESLGTTFSSSGEKTVEADEAKLESSESNGNSSTKLTFEIIKKNLRNQRYKRLDVFQEHMFEVFEDIRSSNRTDSEVYEDVVELQKFFIKIRDELCKNGETLLSPSLTYTLKRLENELDAERKEKLSEENKEDEEMREEGQEKEINEKMQMTVQSDKMDYQGNMYKPGDFVYVENSENMSTPHIVCIEKLYTDDSGERRLYGVWFYRPEATYHTTSKKFFVKEVFKSDYYNTVPVSLIRGRCFVMLAKHYFKMRPVDFDEEDVYVCESRYLSSVKTFKRIKWPQFPVSDTNLVPRESPLPVIRISSCYSDQKDEDVNTEEKPRSLSIQGIDESWPKDIIDREREIIKNESQILPNGVYYNQFFANNMWVKLGDCVYLRQPKSSVYKIVRVDSLWVDGSNSVWMKGPWFVRPEDTQHEPTRMFYKNEVFISSGEATFLFANVAGKCMVLASRDYVACRPTEFAEEDIYFYESKYIETEEIIKKIKSIRRYMPTHKGLSVKHATKWYYWECNVIFKRTVVDDEYYYCKKPIPLIYKVSPYLDKLVQEERLNRENEAKNLKTQQETEEIASSISENAPGFSGSHPNQGRIYAPAQPPPPHPYPQPSHIMTSQPYSHVPYPQQVLQQYPVASSHADPHTPVPTAHPYVQQQFQPGTRYPSPHTGVPPQHIQQYQPPSQIYPPSPHPTMMTPSPGVIQSPDNSRPPSARPEAVPTPPTKRKGRSGHSTGYILFASHYHPKVRSENPDMPFGEISKIVGEEWRKLEEEKKREYEEKAREQTAKAEAEGRVFTKKKKKKKEVEEPTPAPPQPVTPVAPVTQVQQGMVHYPGGQYAHMQGQQAIQRYPMVPVGTPSPYSAQNYQGVPAPMTSYMQTPTGQPYIQHAQVVPAIQQQPPTIAQKHKMKRGPLFVKPPPKAQRVMHSEAYLRYIEGLEKGSESISNWRKTVNIQESDVHHSREEEDKLPVHWLANGKGRYDSTKSALWSLRDLMLKDALAIKNYLAW